MSEPVKKPSSSGEHDAVKSYKRQLEKLDALSESIARGDPLPSSKRRAMSDVWSQKDGFWICRACGCSFREIGPYACLPPNPCACGAEF